MKNNEFSFFTPIQPTPSQAENNNANDASTAQEIGRDPRLLEELLQDIQLHHIAPHLNLNELSSLTVVSKKTREKYVQLKDKTVTEYKKRMSKIALKHNINLDAPGALALIKKVLSDYKNKIIQALQKKNVKEFDKYVEKIFDIIVAGDTNTFTEILSNMSQDEFVKLFLVYPELGSFIGLIEQQDIKDVIFKEISKHTDHHYYLRSLIHYNQEELFPKMLDEYLSKQPSKEQMNGKMNTLIVTAINCKDDNKLQMLIKVLPDETLISPNNPYVYTKAQENLDWNAIFTLLRSYNAKLKEIVSQSDNQMMSPQDIMNDYLNPMLVDKSFDEAEVIFQSFIDCFKKNQDLLMINKEEMTKILTNLDVSNDKHFVFTLFKFRFVHLVMTLHPDIKCPNFKQIQNEVVQKFYQVALATGNEQATHLIKALKNDALKESFNQILIENKTKVENEITAFIQLTEKEIKRSSSPLHKKMFPTKEEAKALSTKITRLSGWKEELQTLKTNYNKTNDPIAAIEQLKKCLNAIEKATDITFSKKFNEHLRIHKDSLENLGHIHLTYNSINDNDNNNNNNNNVPRKS